MAQDPSLAAVLWGQLFCFPILSVKLIPYSVVFWPHPSLLWEEHLNGDVFPVLSGKSLEKCLLCNPECSLSIVTDFSFFDTTLYVHCISVLIRPLLVSRTREHSESQLKPKREFISYYNWMSWGHSGRYIKMLKKNLLNCRLFLPISWFCCPLCHLHSQVSIGDFEHLLACILTAYKT